MDVLLLLRSAISEKHSVQYDAQEKTLSFPSSGGATHSVDVPTAYHQNRGRGEPYSLGTIWFYVTNSGLNLQGLSAFFAIFCS